MCLFPKGQLVCRYSEELIIRYDLPGRLRSLCVVGGGGGGGAGGTSSSSVTKILARTGQAGWGEEEAAAAVGVYKSNPVDP
jgi:hypothetical protein